MNSVGQGGPREPVVFGKPAGPVVLEALSRFIPPQTIAAVLAATGRASRRIRRVPATAAVWMVIGIGLWSDLDLPSIWRQIVGPLRSRLLVLALERPPGKSGLCLARQRLGPLALRRLFVHARRLLCGTAESFIICGTGVSPVNTGETPAPHSMVSYAALPQCCIISSVPRRPPATAGKLGADATVVAAPRRYVQRC